jgi:hypothetical protein
MISAKELMERNKNKNNVKKETYTKIMTQMCRKIEVAHTMGKDGTELKIPEFMFGYPMYNMMHVTIYIFRQLKRLGYRTSVLDVGRLYVAWGEKKTTTKISKEEHKSLPTLSNLKKAADSIRKKYT